MSAKALESLDWKLKQFAKQDRIKLRLHYSTVRINFNSEKSWIKNISNIVTFYCSAWNETCNMQQETTLWKCTAGHMQICNCQLWIKGNVTRNEPHKKLNFIKLKYKKWNYHVYDQKCPVRKYPAMPKFNLLGQRLETLDSSTASGISTLTLTVWWIDDPSPYITNTREQNSSSIPKHTEIFSHLVTALSNHRRLESAEKKKKKENKRKNLSSRHLRKNTFGPDLDSQTLPCDTVERYVAVDD